MCWYPHQRPLGGHCCVMRRQVTVEYSKHYIQNIYISFSSDYYTFLDERNINHVLINGWSHLVNIKARTINGYTLASGWLHKTLPQSNKKSLILLLSVANTLLCRSLMQVMLLGLHNSLVAPPFLPIIYRHPQQAIVHPNYDCKFKAYLRKYCI